MRQISPTPRRRTKVGLIVFCALALMVLVIACSQEVQLEPPPPQSPEPQQSVEPQEPPELQESPQPQQSQRPQEPRESPRPQQSQEPQESPQTQESPPPQESPQPPESQEPHARAVADVRALATLLEDYKKSHGEYPTTGQGLEALGAARKDPWGGDYIYQSPSTRGRESYDYFSAGPDRQPDTPDDDWGGSEDPSQ